MRGITQLVAGPQYATGVGLVQYGANALRTARDVQSIEVSQRPTTMRVAAPSRVDRREVMEESSVERRGSGRFWNWLRAAF
jgi:cell division protein FtsA